MLYSEAYMALFFILFLSFIMAWIVKVCFVEPAVEFLMYKWKHRKGPKYGPEIPMEDVIKLIEEAEFNEMIEKAARGELEGKPLDVHEWVPVLAPCMYHDCPEHETREDCCTSSVPGKDGKQYCKFYFNLNELVGLPVTQNQYPQEDPKKMTEDEVKLFVKCYLEFMKQKQILEAKGNE